MKKNPTILVTNDDGVDSPGILALFDSMNEIGKAIIVAPDRQQSAVSHSLTVSNPLRAFEVKKNGVLMGYSVNGTPTDTAKLALTSLLDEKPDLVISGINHGQNTGINIMYSGTVAAATEGMLLGIPSIAISIASHDYDADITAAAKYAKVIAENILKIDLPKGTMLNVNVPAIDADNIKGMKIVKQSSSIWKDNYEKRSDPFKREYFWFAGEYNIDENDLISDDTALLQGYVTITPIKFSYTDENFIKDLKNLNIF